MKPKCLQILREQKDSNLPGGLYHKVQIQMAYHSNRMEGSRLTEEQTRQMFETHTILAEHAVLYVDDI
ncbi:MAG TPA: cell filamentation protein Fic, partial [Candidatus Agathobaculum merdavium]|nr:cell filamentation protein Fic [Candidatus Agathobaculum merdavium]